jgi:hypothetical protein
MRQDVCNMYGTSHYYDNEIWVDTVVVFIKINYSYNYKYLVLGVCKKNI